MASGLVVLSDVYFPNPPFPRLAVVLFSIREAIARGAGGRRGAPMNSCFTSYYSHKKVGYGLTKNNDTYVPFLQTFFHGPHIRLRVGVPIYILVAHEASSVLFVLLLAKLG
jgi:hypothetical protein